MKDMSLASIFPDEPELLHRFETLRLFGRSVRASEYHITRACNIRCKGCWFFEHKFDDANPEVNDLNALRCFIERERERGINSAVLIGGEPLLVVDRIRTYVESMDYVTLSTNGLRPLPQEGLERVQVFITVFGGGSIDDQLRAIRPNGQRFTGLFETALSNFRRDPRATFVLQLVESAPHMIEPTVKRILENGNKVTLGLYSAYDQRLPLFPDQQSRLLDEAIRVKELFSDVVLNTPYQIHALLTGKAHFGTFGYETCPSISTDHPAHESRRNNGNRTLPLFNTYAQDLKTILFCCTSGHCETCRDSQAVWSWLLVHAPDFLDTREHLSDWVQLAEAYWGQFVWSPIHPKSHEGFIRQQSSIVHNQEH